jgi:SPP1 Gp6-like portal protein
MGVNSVLKWDPVRVAREWVSAPNEKARRRIAQRKRYLLIDNSHQAVREELASLFTDPTVRQRVTMFAHLATSVTLFKRVMSELARPVYLVPPTRTVQPDSAQAAFAQIATETGLDDVCARWLIMALATGTAFAYPRFVQRLGRIVCDVISADAATVIPDPDDPCSMLAVIYDKPVHLVDGHCVTWHVYWDDEVTFQLDENGNMQPFAPGEKPVRANPFGRIPIVDLHTSERTDGYWCPTAGEPLVNANMAVCMLTSLALRGLKARGFNQLVVTGDAMRFPKGQALDEESAIMAPDGTNIVELANAADASNYLTLIDAIEARAAAEYGISRARLNREKEDTDDTGLTEQRAEMVKLMAVGERRLFEVIKLISGETTDRQLPPEATMSVDFGEYQFRADPEAELRIWDQKRRMGVRNVLDQVKAENPECLTDEDARAELERNLRIESEFILQRRALNISDSANVYAPGQNPQANGAMGPAVRDGKMSPQAAADQAQSGLPSDQPYTQQPNDQQQEGP